MNIQYSLTEKDFLEYQLFTASKSKNIKSQRLTTLIAMVLILGILLFYIYSTQKEISFLALIIGIVLIFFYNISEKRRYEKYYKKFIKEYYKNRLGLIFNLTFNEDQFEESSVLGNSQIYYSSLTEINETKDYYFLKLLTSQSLIIPKNTISDITEFQKILEKLKAKHKIKQNIELNWKWK